MPHIVSPIMEAIDVLEHVEPKHEQTLDFKYGLADNISVFAYGEHQKFTRLVSIHVDEDLSALMLADAAYETALVVYRRKRNSFVYHCRLAGEIFTALPADVQAVVRRGAGSAREQLAARAMLGL